jgi:hypothetical protein
MVGGAQYGTMVDHYVYVQLQGSSSVPSGNYTISVQGTVTGHTLTNPTTTSLRVNFPSFSNPAPGKYVVYWQKVGSAGANYVNLTPASSYVINGLNSNQSYKVWVKYMDISSSTGSQIYAAAVTANTTAGCGGNLGAPSVVQTVGHCKQVDVSWISVTSQGVPTNLVPAASTYPYRVLYNYTNGTGFHGFIQALASQPVAGYHVANLPLSQLVNFSYTFKCVGGAVMSSYTQAFTTCAGPARAVAPTHTEYVIGDVHYVDASEEELMSALSANMVDDGEIHEFNLVNIANEGKSEVEAAIAAGTFELIPNPTSSNVTVNYSLPTANATSATVRVMDVQGKVVREEKLSNPSQNGSVKFELTELEAGVYLVNIQSEGYTETKKLVVSK